MTEYFRAYDLIFVMLGGYYGKDFTTPLHK